MWTVCSTIWTFTRPLQFPYVQYSTWWCNVILCSLLTLNGDANRLLPHSRIWHRRVSLTSRHSALLLVTLLDTPIPQDAEQGDQSVVCRKHVDGMGRWDFVEEIHSKHKQQVQSIISDNKVSWIHNQYKCIIINKFYITINVQKGNRACMLCAVVGEALFLYTYHYMVLLHCCPMVLVPLLIAHYQWGHYLSCILEEWSRALCHLQQCGCHHHTPTLDSSVQAVWWGEAGHSASQGGTHGVGREACSLPLHPCRCRGAHS